MKMIKPIQKSMKYISIKHNVSLELAAEYLRNEKSVNRDRLIDRSDTVAP